MSLSVDTRNGLKVETTFEILMGSESECEVDRVEVEIGGGAGKFEKFEKFGIEAGG